MVRTSKARVHGWHRPVTFGAMASNSTSSYAAERGVKERQDGPCVPTGH
jgi:hypothetical protein